MSELTPAQHAIARALVGDGWETDADIDDDARESIAAAARDVDAAARPHVQAELLRDLAAELRASRKTGGIEYVDATWLEDRAAVIEREAREAPVTDLTPAAQVDAWNTAHPVGSRVQYWPGTYDAASQTGVTTHPAMVLGGHTPVVWIDTCGSCVALTHVRVLESRADQIGRGGGDRG